MMKCYYDILEIPKDASQADIVKAYKRQALKAHPDKNILSPEIATLLFTEISNAYEVLSDEHERKWYDSHKFELLRGPLDLSRRGTSLEFMAIDEVLFLTSKACLKFSDIFYQTFRDFYIKIDLEEQKAQEIDPSSNQSIIDFHTFGDERISGHELQSFYNRFLGFHSVKSFYWFDVCEPIKEPDRCMRRQAEKTNKKARDSARKSFSDAVINLTVLVRKNDPRVLKQLEIAEKESKVKQKKIVDEKNQSRLDALNLGMDYIEPEWSQATLEFSDAEYECVVCDLVFATSAKLRKHEFSRSHCLQLEILRGQMNDQPDDFAYENNDEILGEQELNINGIVIDDENSDALDRIERFDCLICKKEFKIRLHLDQHMQSKKHRNEAKNEVKSNNIAATTIPHTSIKARIKTKDARRKPIGIHCRVCKVAFSSRTKLFQHLESTKHASIY